MNIKICFVSMAATQGLKRKKIAIRISNAIDNKIPHFLVNL